MSPPAPPETIALLSNPGAGRGDALRQIERARRALAGRDLEILHPRTPAEVTAFCRALDPRRHLAAVVLGGDGTCNHAIRGLRTSGVPLYPFPVGLANDLHSRSGIRADWHQARALIANRRVKHQPLLLVNGLPIATVGGLGGPADIVERFDTLRQGSRVGHAAVAWAGMQTYALVGAATVLRAGPLHRKVRMRIWADDRETSPREEIATLGGLFVCVQAVLGGTLKLSPGPAPEAGFSVVAIPARGRVRQLEQLTRVRFGLPGDDFHRFGATRLEVAALDGRPLTVFGDGEQLTAAETLRFERSPTPLAVFTASAAQP